VSDLSPDCVAPLVADSERAGLRLVRRLATEWTSGENRFDRPGEALFVAIQAQRVIGVCGLNVDPYTPAPGVGRVRHLYVLTSCRRLGVGRRLVEAVVTAATGRFDVLRLRTNNPAAARLYEAIGFEPRTGEADCTHRLTLTAPP
jgi:ribosomal protein S18 acetylase RimI-like enzyme